MGYDILTGESTEILVKKLVHNATNAPDGSKMTFAVTAQWYSAPGGRVDVYVAVCKERDVVVTANSVDELILKAADMARHDFKASAVFEFPCDRYNDNGAVINIRVNRMMNRAWANAERRINQIRGPGQ